jgi:phage terminase small subunit
VSVKNLKARRRPLASKGLTERQKLFIKEYLIDLNATQAAIRAGYGKGNLKNADKLGSELLGNPRVREQIQIHMDKRAERIESDGDKVLKRLLHIADTDIADVYDEKGFLKSIHAIPVEVRKCIKSIKIFEEFDGVGRDRTKIGETVEVKFWDKLKANELIGRHHKLFTDKIEITDKTDLAKRLTQARKRAATNKRK